jgi:hypothetical protein
MEQYLNPQENIMILSAWRVLTPENIEFLKNYDPPITTGFLFDSNAKIIKIKERIEQAYPGHSGASLAYTLRILYKLIRMASN